MPGPSGGLHKELFGTLLTDIDSAVQEDVGALRADEDGNIYIYLKGIASIVAGDVVTYKILSATDATIVRATAGTKGPIAVAMAAIVADKFGWFQIVGFNAAVKAISSGDAAAGGRVFLTSTAGSVDDVQVFGDEIQGMIFTVQEGAGALGNGFAGVHLTNPRVAETRIKPTLTQVDSSALRTVGERYRDDETGAEYIYLQGIASVAIGSWVTFDILTNATSTTALLVANGKGPVAVAMAAVIASKFGWFQIFGYTVVAKAISGGDAAAGAILVSTSTAGSVDDAPVAGDYIFGALCTVQEGESPSSAGNVGVYLTYPFVTDLTGIHTA